MLFQAVDDEYYYYKRPLASEIVVSPHLLKVVERETQKRREEATLMKTKQETDSVSTLLPSFKSMFELESVTLAVF